MIRNKNIWTVIVAAGVVAATSCSDFSDYNEAYTDSVNASADKTLWENIESNPQLSKFASLVKKAGFDTNLQSSRYYTVWAPLDDAIDMSAYEQMDSAQLLQEFVQNHVAEYNHSASGSIDERIRTLNNKSYDFVGSGSYTYDGVQVGQANLPSTNGVLHTLGGVAAFYPNAYSYILEKGEGIDSVRNYFQRYQVSYLDENNSVIGPIVDGKQTYIDSVMVSYNDMFSSLRAILGEEDSSYTAILPTDTAWNALYAKIKPKYNYLQTMLAQDLASSTSASSIPSKSMTVNNTYLADSLTKIQMVSDLFFSNNAYYNQKLNNESPTFSATDTLYSTIRSKLSNPTDILAQARTKEKLSNGNVYLVDSVASYSWETYSPEIVVSARHYYGRVLTGTVHQYTLTWTHNGEDRYYSYLWAEPTSAYAKPEVDVYLPNVRSTTYNFYCVFAPGWDGNADTLSTKPNKVNFTLNYLNAKGALADYKFSSDGAENPKTAVAFINDPVKRDSAGWLIPDTVFLGKFTFPVSYAGLSSSDISPNIKITTPFSQFSSDMKVYTRDLRIMGFILKPVELDEYEATKE